LVAPGASGSTTAAQFLSSAIISNNVYKVLGVDGDPGVMFAQANQDTDVVTIDFKDWSDMRTGSVDPRTFNIGSQLVHELIHVHNDAQDPRSHAKATQTGPVVDYVNEMRAERGLPARGPMYQGEIGGWRGDRIRVPFIVDPARPKRIRWISAKNF
jgi:hypothetical protein